MLNQKTPFSFLDFRTIEFTLATDLNRLADIARKLDAVELVSQFAHVRQTLEQRSFSVAIVGEFKRGKSTFINALLGKEILPSDIAPTSATLNRVTYGLRPSVKIVYKGEHGQAGHIEEIGIDQLNAYVTKLTPEAAAIAAQVQEAIVYYPIPYCQNNVSIIDTPGLNDDDAMTAVTFSVLSQVDAAIMVIMPEAPFAGSEGDFLNNLLAHDIGKVMFVVTAIDRVRRAQDRERVLKLISTRIRERLMRRAAERFGEGTDDYQAAVQQIGEPKVFGVSGYDALQGKMTNDGALFEASGFQAFETALETFLTRERGAVALKVVADRMSVHGEKLAKALGARRAELLRRRDALDNMTQQIAYLWGSITTQHQREASAIDSAQAHTQHRIEQLLDWLREEMSRTSLTAIQTASLTVEEINRASLGALGSVVQRGGRRFFDVVSNHLSDNMKQSGQNIWQKATEKLSDGSQRSVVLATLVEQIASALRETLLKVFENMAVVLRYELGRELQRLGGYVTSVKVFVAELDQRFASDPQLSAPVSAFVDTANEAIALVTEAQAKTHDYYVNALRSFGQEFIQEFDPESFALGQCNRALLALRQVRTILNGNERVELFKTSYSDALNTELAQVLDQRAVAQQIDKQVGQAFQQIKCNIQSLPKDVDEVMQPLRQLLRDVQERRLTLIERDLNSLDEMDGEAQQILQRAYTLSAEVAALIES